MVEKQGEKKLCERRTRNEALGVMMSGGGDREGGPEGS